MRAGRSGPFRRKTRSVPFTGTAAPESEASETLAATGLPAVGHSPSVQTPARQATVPISKDDSAERASPVPSVTVAVTVNRNDGSFARSAVGAATGVNSTAKEPFSSVVASPCATKRSPSSSSSPPPQPNQRHQSG